MIKLKGLLNEGSDNEKELIIQLLVKWGNTKQESIKMVNKHYPYVSKTYPRISARTKAGVIQSL